MPDDLNEMRWCYVGSTSVIVFVEEPSLRVLAVHLAERSHKYHRLDVVEKCTDQSVGHQRHHTTHLRKSDVATSFRHFHVDYQDPINGSFLYCWLRHGKWASSVNKMLWIMWGLNLIQQHNSNWLKMSAGSRCWLCCIHTTYSTFSILNWWTFVASWNCVVGLIFCRSNLKPYCMGRKTAFFQQAFKFTYYNSNRSPLHEKKIITIRLKKTEW